MTLKIFSTENRIINRMGEGRKLRRIIRKMNTKIANLAFPRNRKTKTAKGRFKLGSERRRKRRSTRPRNNDRKLRRGIEFTDPFRKGRLGIFPRSIRIGSSVKPLNKILNRL